jgi:hypothetical protein
MRLAVLTCTLASFASLTACTTPADEFVDAAAQVEGIYRVTTYTRNDQACVPGGASLLTKETFAFAATQELFGITLLDVFSCDAPADCRAKLAKLDAGGGFGLDFGFSVSSVDREVLVGDGASTGFAEGTVCIGGEVTRTRLVVEGATLRLQQEITIADSYPADADGFCTTDAAKAAARGNACSALEVLTADFVEPL